MTHHHLRVFTQSGMEEFRQRWNTAANTRSQLEVSDMVEHPNWTRPITQEAVVEICEFPNRRHCGEYFVALFNTNQNALDAASINPASSVELWAWLSAVWCKWLQHKDGSLLQNRNGPLGESSRWLFEPNNRWRYYRHLLAGPYLVVAANHDDPSRAQILLYNEVVSPNTRWVETICGSEEVHFNKPLLFALSKKLLDPSTGKPYSSTNRLTRRDSYFIRRGLDVSGTIDRLTQVYNQLILTWDLHATDLEQMTNLFGTEFREFFPTGN